MCFSSARCELNPRREVRSRLPLRCTSSGLVINAGAASLDASGLLRSKATWVEIAATPSKLLYKSEQFRSWTPWTVQTRRCGSLFRKKCNDSIPCSIAGNAYAANETHTLQTKRILPATIPVVLATALVTVLALALAVAVTIAVVGVVDAVVLVVLVVVVVVVVASGLMPGRPPLLASRFLLIAPATARNTSAECHPTAARTELQTPTQYLIVPHPQLHMPTSGEALTANGHTGDGSIGLIAVSGGKDLPGETR